MVVWTSETEVFWEGAKVLDIRREGVAVYLCERLQKSLNCETKESNAARKRVAAAQLIQWLKFPKTEE